MGFSSVVSASTVPCVPVRCKRLRGRSWSKRSRGLPWWTPKETDRAEGRKGWKDERMAQELVWNQLVWNMGVLWVSSWLGQVVFNQRCRSCWIWRGMRKDFLKAFSTVEICFVMGAVGWGPRFKPFRTLPLCLEPSRHWQEKWAWMAGHLKWWWQVPLCSDGQVAVAADEAVQSSCFHGVSKFSPAAPNSPNLPGGKVVLPAGMLVQLVLPCAYYRRFDHKKGWGGEGGFLGKLETEGFSG